MDSQIREKIQLKMDEVSEILGKGKGFVLFFDDEGGMGAITNLLDEGDVYKIVKAVHKSIMKLEAQNRN
jgi:cold shock CspA family protein